jgi:solute carrier family 25 oxoglutarate transporter 11
MSLASSSGKVGNQSFASYLSSTVKERGVLSLYKGLSAGILRQTFYATSRFGLFEVIRDEVAKHRPTDIFSRLFSGCVSGAMAAFISCPAEVTLVRISNDANLPIDQRRNYTGVVNAFTRIIKEEGVKTFFNGSGPFVNRAMMVGMVQIGDSIYLHLKYTYI